MVESRKDNLPIIDSHVHIGRDKKYRFKLTPRELLGKMKKVGVEYALIFFCPWTEKMDYVKENRYIVKVSKKFKNLYPVLFVNPLSQESIKEIRILLKEGEIRGIKLHPSAGKYSPNTILETRVIEIAEEFGLPLIVHTSYHRKYKEVIEIAREFSHPLIAAHAFRFKKSFLEEAKTLSNLYLDPCPLLTLLNAGRFSRFVLGNSKELVEPARNRNPENLFRLLFEIMNGRIVWGTDEPWSSRMTFSVGYEAEVNFIKSIAPRLREKIMQNTQKIFKINC